MTTTYLFDDFSGSGALRGRNPPINVGFQSWYVASYGSNDGAIVTGGHTAFSSSDPAMFIAAAATGATFSIEFPFYGQTVDLATGTPVSAQSAVMEAQFIVPDPAAFTETITFMRLAFMEYGGGGLSAEINISRGIFPTASYHSMQIKFLGSDFSANAHTYSVPDAAITPGAMYTIRITHRPLLGDTHRFLCEFITPTLTDSFEMGLHNSVPAYITDLNLYYVQAYMGRGVGLDSIVLTADDPPPTPAFWEAFFLSHETP